MAKVTPYLTTNGLVEQVQRTIAFPLSQNTFNYNDLVKFLNQELQLNAVPTLIEEHQEYFVFKQIIPLLSNINRYEIPYRAIGMTLRDLKYSDDQGNFYDMTRVAPDDKAFFQQAGASTQALGKYYLEGNEIVFTPQMFSNPTGNLNFFFNLRPNQLVKDDRAAIIEGFKKEFTLLNNDLTTETAIQIFFNIQSDSVQNINLVAGTNFAIGATVANTAGNIATAISQLSIKGLTASSTASVVTVNYDKLATNFGTLGAAGIISVDLDNILIKFDQLSSVYTDPITDQQETLYETDSLVDFLQTNPGHRTYVYDVPLTNLDNTVGRVPRSALLTYAGNYSGGTLVFVNLKVGDYICLQNECIIPQIPPELHHALAERAAYRVQAAIGDRDGAAVTKSNIAEMDRKQQTLIGSRIEGSVPKVFNRYSLLRSGRSKFGRSF